MPYRVATARTICYMENRPIVPDNRIIRGDKGCHMPIQAANMLRIENPKLYKVHLASWNGEYQPLDVFLRSREEWQEWNEWRGEKDDFNRPYIFALIDFYHEPNTWLFGGIFEVVERMAIVRGHGYRVRLSGDYSDLIGRLKISWPRSGRAKSRRLENLFDEFVVKEILVDEYTGEPFRGYEEVCLDFSELEVIFANAKPDWKAALEHVKGVYMIIDRSNGKKYVGSAYGEQGVWARWSNYMVNGHGNNNELSKLLYTKGIGYARENFKVSLLEYRPMKTDDAHIIQRENYWKEALLSRGEFGYNDN